MLQEKKVIDRFGQHDHAPKGVNVEVRRFRRRLHQEVFATEHTPQAVAANAFEYAPAIVLANMPTLSTIRRGVRRHRQEAEGIITLQHLRLTQCFYIKMSIILQDLSIYCSCASCSTNIS